jgi:small subunit ribosomal protein S16
MLKIRLQRTGRKNRPAYRIVVCEHTAPIKGKFLEKLGHYDPLLKECRYDEERVNHWLSVGAQASDTVAYLLEKKGKIEQKKRTRVGKRQKEKLEALEQEKAQAKAAEEAAKLKAKEEAEAAKLAEQEAKEAAKLEENNTPVDEAASTEETV